eukprot:4733748-Heterocapsa_arctica.AAC.1
MRGAVYALIGSGSGRGRRKRDKKKRGEDWRRKGRENRMGGRSTQEDCDDVSHPARVVCVAHTHTHTQLFAKLERLAQPLEGQE